jgi:hypothetical protein
MSASLDAASSGDAGAVVEALAEKVVAFAMAMALGGLAAGGSEDPVSVDGLAILADHLNLHVLSSGAESGGVFE